MSSRSESHQVVSRSDPQGRTGEVAREDRSAQVSLAASASSIIAALAASACCIGPLVFALLGIGGAGLLVKFEPYRPIFTVVTLGLLGTGFYFTYRKPKTATVAEADACGCERPKTNRAGKIMLWFATVLVALFLAFPYLAPILFG
jgi:mercuric ion transport protein